MPTTRRASQALPLDYRGGGIGWKRHARVAMLITLALGGVLMLLGVAHALSLYGPGSLLDWLLPRL